MTDLNEPRFIRHWQQWPSRLALFLIAGAFAVPLACEAAPGARNRLKAADLEGESQVPGFPTTPANLTRDYINAFMRAEADSFGYHVGDDAAWQQDHETVVAIGPGIVRSVDLGQKSWGGLVVIEHASAAGGRFCSLHGHLGPLVCVQPGQIVRQGEKVGAIGPSFSHANGGYLAHLHLS